MITTAAKLRPGATRGQADVVAAVTVLHALAARIRHLQAEATAHEKTIRALVRAWRADLLDLPGIGPIVAATVLTAWSHPGRCRNDAAFAMLAGTAPIPASSGKTIRHRLNRSGDRQLNRALHTVVLSRLQRDPATRAYAERRRPPTTPPTRSPTRAPCSGAGCGTAATTTSAPRATSSHGPTSSVPIHRRSRAGETPSCRLSGTRHAGPAHRSGAARRGRAGGARSAPSRPRGKRS
jgi:hypothetical protein